MAGFYPSCNFEVVDRGVNDGGGGFERNKEKKALRKIIPNDWRFGWIYCVILESARKKV